MFGTYAWKLKLLPWQWQNPVACSAASVAMTTTRSPELSEWLNQKKYMLDSYNKHHYYDTALKRRPILRFSREKLRWLSWFVPLQKICWMVPLASVTNATMQIKNLWILRVKTGSRSRDRRGVESGSMRTNIGESKGRTKKRETLWQDGKQEKIRDTELHFNQHLSINPHTQNG